MKVLAVILAFGLACVSANQVIWMELMSSQIMEAEEAFHSTDDPNIPALATKLKLNDLVEFVKAARLVDALSGKGPLTVFGPTDKAFGRLPKKFVDFLKKNTTVLAAILEYHVASGQVLSSDLKNDMLVKTLQGSNIRINKYEKKDGAIFTASGRVIEAPDNKASNGVIHVVGGVLFPAPGTITFVVSKCPVFSKLLVAVQAAGLADLLDGNGPFTVFAPSNRAIERIPSTCWNKLLANKELLTKVLKYHVVASTQYSAGLYCGESVKTAEGGSVTIKKMWGHVRVNDACVTYADGTASNGVIHVINRVLWPKDSEDFCPEGNLDYDDGEEETKTAPFIF